MPESQAEKDRSRVSFTVGSIAKVKTAGRRYLCQNHLDPEDHYVEPGQRYVHNSLPPHNSEIGNETWWHLRVCLDCCPAEYDERIEAWVDRQGDVWRLGPDGLMHTPETRPFPLAYVERKWGPLRPAKEIR